jgi:ribosomal protein S18 acetylase RimI-like enzyme
MNGPQRRASPRLAAIGSLAAVLLASACASLPPDLPRSYVRVDLSGREERLVAERERSSGVYPGANVAIGTLFEERETHATGMELEVGTFHLGSESGDLDGWGFIYRGGVRRFWNLDGRVRPNAGFGASWTETDIERHQRAHEPHGAGAYVDVGVDYMLTPRQSVGLRLRPGLRYEKASAVHGFYASAELALLWAWRF